MRLIFRFIFFLITSMVSANCAFGQNSIECQSYLEGERLGSYFEGFIGQYDGKYYVSEFRSSTESGYTSVLSIRMIRGDNLQLVNSKKYNDIAFGFSKKTRYRYIRTVLMSDVLKILVFDKVTGSVGFLSLDILSLEIRSGWEEVYSLTELYEISASELSKEITLGNFYFLEYQSKSSNGLYSSILIRCYGVTGRMNKSCVLSILINNKSEVEHVIQFETLDYQSGHYRAISQVSDDGLVAILGWTYWRDRDENIAKNGNRLRLLNRKGDEIFFDKLEISNYPEAHDGQILPLKMKIKEQKLYLVNFDTRHTGYVTGVFDISSLHEKHTLNFTPFLPKTKMLFMASNHEELTKITERAKKKNNLIRYMGTYDFKVLSDNSFVVTSAKRFAADYSRKRWEMTRVMVSKFDSTGLQQFNKVLHVDYSSHGMFDDPLVYPAPYEINGMLALFVNCAYDDIKGYGMVDESPGTSTQGGIVWMATNGKGWKKEPFNCEHNSEQMLVYPDEGIFQSESIMIFPSRPWHSKNVGYSKLEFK